MVHRTISFALRAKRSSPFAINDLMASLFGGRDG
jgi:hypothetical protein